MLFDKQNLFSDNQEITTTAFSKNVVCMAKGTIKEVAFGEQIPLRIQVTKAFAGLTSLSVSVETDINEEFSSAETLAESGAIDAGKLVDGYVFPINFVPRGNKGYMRLKYTVSGTATSGAITAGIVAKNGGGYHEV